MILTTARLRLEPWVDGHLEGLQAMNGDPAVMRYITGRAYRAEETLAEIRKVQGYWRKFGYSWWSFFETGTGQIVGAGCIQHLAGDPNNPLEIGWRIRRDKWRQGLAFEAAIAMAAFAFGTLGAPVLCAICHPQNTVSESLMKKLGMHFQARRSLHDMPVLVYEISRDAWAARAAESPSTVLNLRT